jgi:hypothetical protein
MLEFNNPFKLYLFKNKNTVDWAIRVNSNYVHTYTIPQEQFEELLANWSKPEGYGILIKNIHISVQYKKFSPRPELAAASYLKLTVYNQNMQHHFRFDLSDMIELEKDYFYQKNNQMYWD